MLFFLLYDDPNCAVYVNFKMKTLCSALKLDYLKSTKLSTENCVYTVLKTPPLSTRTYFLYLYSVLKTTHVS